MTTKQPLPFGGDWTAEKLECIRKYLYAYTKALKDQPFHLTYIDAFAGTGYCGKGKTGKNGEHLFGDLAQEDTQKFLKGSARIALEVEPSFDNYIFVDHDPNNCAELDNLKNEFPLKQGKITIVNKEANEYLKELTSSNWKNQRKRGVLFLDPYGMQVSWSTVQSIAQTQAIDMWYLFPIAAVNRLLRKDATIGSAERNRLNLIFGTEDWEQVFYQRKTYPTLFGEDEIIQKIASIDAIKDYLLERLRIEFAGIAENPLVLENSRNSPIFLLCFAVGNKNAADLAKRIAQHILKR